MQKLIITDDNGRRELTLEKKEIVLGRSEDCDVILKSQAVSRRHTCITKEGPFFFACDLNSTNGTFLNGIKISEKTALAHRDSIAIGHCAVEYYDSEGAELEETAIRMASEFREAASAMPLKFHVGSLIDGINGVREELEKLNSRIPETTSGTKALKNTLDLITSEIDVLLEKNRSIFEVVEKYEKASPVKACDENKNVSSLTAAKAVDVENKDSGYQRVLGEIKNIISSVEDYKKASKFILSVAMKILDTNRGFIVFKDPTIGSIVPLVAEIGSSEFAESAPSMLVAKYSINKAETIIVADPMLDERFMGMSESIVSGVIKSVICVPLIKNAICLGAIYMDNTNHKKNFSGSDSDFVAELSVCISELLEKNGVFSALLEEYEDVGAREEKTKAYLELFESLKNRLLIEGIVRESDIGRIAETIKKSSQSPCCVIGAGGYCVKETLANFFKGRGIERAELSRHRLTKSLMSSITKEYAISRSVVPFSRTLTRELSLAMADPLDRYTIAEIERCTGCSVKPFYCFGEEILKSLEMMD